MDGQTKQPMSALLKNLSHPTYAVDGRTKPPMGALVKQYKSSYQWGGWKNQATNGCLGQKI